MLRFLKLLIVITTITLITLLALFIQAAKAEEISNQNVVSNILDGYDKIKNSSCSKNKKNGFRIFVSLSMPKSLLEQYDKQAKQIGAKLVIRGFKNNSFKETIQYTQKIAMEVDPMAFRKFSVTSVPSFVLSDNSKFDKIIGNVSIKYALEQFEAKGDLKQKAKKYLMRLR